MSEEKTQHTPGPWFYQGHGSEVEQRGLVVAQVRSNNTKADARLIAAAPELLAAAKNILADAQDRGETIDDDGAEYEDFKALRKAIEKAEGK